MVGKAWLVMLASVWGSGCVSDTDPESSPAAFCEGLCEGMLRCGTWQTSASACESDCIGRQSGLLDFSESHTRRYGECLSGAACMTFFEDATWGRCWDAARAAVTPSAKVRSFCVAFVRSAFECGYGDSTDGCEQDFGIWSDGVIGRVSSCESSADCDGVLSCVNGVFEAL